MKYANTYKFRKNLGRQIEKYFFNQISSVEVNRYLKYKDSFLAFTKL